MAYKYSNYLFEYLKTFIYYLIIFQKSKDFKIHVSCCKRNIIYDMHRHT